MIGWLVLAAFGIALIVWGAETFADNLAMASTRLGVSPFALAVLLAGAEPEELATVVTASLRDSPGIALGDVVGANVAICLVALGVGAILAPMPFNRRVKRYALAGIPAGALAAVFVWDGTVARVEGAILVFTYGLFIATIWILERQPPTLGETGELAEVAEQIAGTHTSLQRVGRELFMTVLGVAAMAVGAIALVEGVRRISDIEKTQTRLGLIVVGFATAFELVVLAWTSARKGISTAVVAGVIGSFTYNVTMTLGAGALARPLRIEDAELIRGPWIAMLVSLAMVLALAWRAEVIRRPGGIALCALYPVFVGVVLFF